MYIYIYIYIYIGCFSINMTDLVINSATSINDIILYFPGLIDDRRTFNNRWHAQWKKKHFVQSIFCPGKIP